MKCLIFILVLLVLNMNVRAAPFFNQLHIHQPIQQPIDQVMITHQPMNQMMIGQPAINPIMLNQMMEEQFVEQVMQQNQYNALQQQMIAMQQLQAQQMNAENAPMLNLPPQPLIILVPDTIIKSSNRLDNPNQSDQPNTKLDDGDSDSIVINTENELNSPENVVLPRRAMMILPNGQRFFIGNIISAIPFLPFEVNVPDTIAWMYNGIAGIIGGIGQRLPFRPKPTESTELLQSQGAEMPIQESRFKLFQKLMTRRQSAYQHSGMPILMVPVAQAVPIQVPIEM